MTQQSESQSGCQPQIKAVSRMVFSELGWKAEVEVLEDKSDAQRERYKLKVVRIVHQGYLGVGRFPGETFEVEALESTMPDGTCQISTKD